MTIDFDNLPPAVAEYRARVMKYNADRDSARQKLLAETRDIRMTVEQISNINLALMIHDPSFFERFPDIDAILTLLLDAVNSPDATPDKLLDFTS